MNWGMVREKEKRCGEEGMPLWEGRQPKKDSANNIASLFAVGKAKEEKRVT